MKYLQSLKFKCPDNCEEILRFEEIKEHYKKCVEREYWCPNKCSKVKAKEMVKHLREECPMIKEKCEKCDMQYMRKEKDDHECITSMKQKLLQNQQQVASIKT